ncbi:unnamed protein product [Allacma fusca]|uniref:Uncharacterized protein n=1 Tax=Allacma fusca TaxID=39272 RepID=A0A8J2LAX5_9HEXA|nr:unnamed protein product [Allacma fusca]
MEFLGSSRLDVPMAEMTEVPVGTGGRKSPANLNVPQEHQQRRSVTGYDASYEETLKGVKTTEEFMTLIFLNSRANSLMNQPHLSDSGWAELGRELNAS